MATYQATAGMRVMYGATYSAATTAIDGITKTPAKGGSPDTVDLSIISEKFKRSLAGQQSLDQLVYEFAPDFTASTGNVAVIQTSLLGNSLWVYEEYTEAGTNPGCGVLMKVKFTGMSLGEQTGSSAQTGSLYGNLDSASIYVGDDAAMASKTWTDLFTGDTVTTPA